MKVLSIVWTRCSTAALMVDGEILGCASEERFSRCKNDERYPQRAIEALLKFAGVRPSELDAVVFGGEEAFDAEHVLLRRSSRFSISDFVREQHDYWFPRLCRQRNGLSRLDLFKDRIDVEQFPGRWDAIIGHLKNGNGSGGKTAIQEFARAAVTRHLGIGGDRVFFVDHHRAHAYYAYYGSPLGKDGVLILTADGWGDGRNATVSLGNGSNIASLSSSSNLQLARLYRYVTLLLAMQPDDHEYKVMGLAPYAKDTEGEKAFRIFAEIQEVSGLGFVDRAKPKDLYFHFKDRLEGMRFDSIAGGVQRYAERLLVQWAGNAARETGARRLVFGGGVGMNVKAMMRIAQRPEIDELFVCPTPADESLAIGAAYVWMHDTLRSRGEDPVSHLKPLSHTYLGVGTSAQDTRACAEGFVGDPAYKIHEGTNVRHVAQQLASGKIVGRCMGRAEFGARALGNRSILADPRKMDVVRRINEGVKNRDFWMPFAPTILSHRGNDYLVNPKGLAAPYMTLAFDTTVQAQQDLVAALHPSDFTCRPQLLSREQNAPYHELLLEYETLTGVGGILNTSFNLHGEPIVQTPSDAAAVFRKSGIDLLVLDGCMVERTRSAGEHGSHPGSVLGLP